MATILQDEFDKLEHNAREVVWIAKMEPLTYEDAKKTRQRRRQRSEMLLEILQKLTTDGEAIRQAQSCMYCWDAPKAGSHWFCLAKRTELGLTRTGSPQFNATGAVGKALYGALMAGCNDGYRRRTAQMQQLVDTWRYTMQEHRQEMRHKEKKGWLQHVQEINHEYVRRPYIHEHVDLPTRERRDRLNRCPRYAIVSKYWHPRRTTNGKLMHPASGWICEHCTEGNDKVDERCAECDCMYLETEFGLTCDGCGWIRAPGGGLELDDPTDDGAISAEMHQRSLECGCGLESFEAANWRICHRCMGLHQRLWRGSEWAIHKDNILCPHCGSLTGSMEKWGHRYYETWGESCVPVEMLPMYDSGEALDRTKATKRVELKEPDGMDIVLMLQQVGSRYWPEDQMWAVHYNQFALLCGAELDAGQTQNQHSTYKTETLEIVDGHKVERRRLGRCRHIVEKVGDRCAIHTGDEGWTADKKVYVMPSVVEDVPTYGTREIPQGYWYRPNSESDLQEMLSRPPPRKHNTHAPRKTGPTDTPDQQRSKRHHGATMGSGSPTPKRNARVEDDYMVSPIESARVTKEKEMVSPQVGQKRSRDCGDTPERAKIVKASKHEQDEDADAAMRGGTEPSGPNTGVGSKSRKTSPTKSKATTSKKKVNGDQPHSG